MASQISMSQVCGRFYLALDRCSGSHTAVLAAVFAGGAIALTGVYLYKFEKRRQLRTKAEERARRAKINIDKLREELYEVAINSQLAAMSFTDLRSALQQGNVKAVDVLRAFQAKALDVNERTNAITDIVNSAQEVASRLDSLPPDQRGPLHGIPISVKETCGLKGEDCTAGFAELVNVPLEQDSILVQVLKLKGAVPFIRTNCPQGMRSFGCDNPIYGNTTNPHNNKRGPGGSSSGEGALVGGRGSILGVGSDIGGSVRIPAAYSGCCSLKPTSGRLGYYGNFNPGTVNAQNIVLSTDGPLGRDVASLVYFMRAVVGPDLWALEPSIPRVPFNEELLASNKTLRIGVYTDNGCTRPVPAAERAVLEARAVLQSLGHKMVDFNITPWAFEAFFEIEFPLLLADDGHCYDKLLKYDRSSPSMRAFYEACKTPSWKGYLMSKITPYDPTIESAMTRKHFRSVDDWFQFTAYIQEFRQRFAEKMKREQIDLLLCPTMPCPANTAGIDAECINLASYTGVWNTMNYPAGVVPVTKVTPDDVTNAQDSRKYPATTLLEKVLQSDAEGSEGLPISVQLVGLPYKEEMVLRVMAELESVMKF